MDSLVIATANKNKFKEIKKMFKGLSFELKCLLDFKDRPQIIEDKKTFYQNAKKKAEITSSFYGCPALGEDSGLEVFALNKEPGIYSARYAGEDSNDKKNIEKLLKELEGVPFQERGARFVCSAVLILKGKKAEEFRGQVEGFITTEPRGKGGFGYDPVFYLPELKKTMAQIPLSLKNKISHRHKAISLIKNYFLKK